MAGFSLKSYLENADATETVSFTEENPDSIYNRYPFYFQSDKEIELEESDSPENSKNPYLWLDSGGMVNIKNGIAKTIQSDSEKYSYWRVAYFLDNPRDTDNGYHPQNVLRLVTKAKWLNFTEEATFRINKYNLSKSENRNESNGILLFSRYKDQNNTYYAGLRVDGAVVIKKKIGGKYTTLALKEIIPGYDPEKNPNVLPINKWIGLKVETINKSPNEVLINLYIDENCAGIWTKVLSATDNSKALTGSGSAGIRTDFMDVEIKDYKINPIE